MAQQILMEDAVGKCREALTASPLRLATLQVEVDRVFHRLMGDLCTGRNQTETSALIWEGADGEFVEACLNAQSVAWPDANLRLNIAENAVGLLDNCGERKGLVARKATSRLLAGLVALEGLISTASAPKASGALESYVLCIPRLLMYEQLKWGDEACAAIDTLVSLLKRRDLETPSRRGAAQLLGDLASSAPDHLELQAVKDALFDEMLATLQEANPYLRAHAAYAKLDADGDATRAFETVRDHRNKGQRDRASQETAHRNRNRPMENAAAEEARVDEGACDASQNRVPDPPRAMASPS